MVHLIWRGAASRWVEARSTRMSTRTAPWTTSVHASMHTIRVAIGASTSLKVTLSGVWTWPRIAAKLTMSRWLSMAVMLTMRNGRRRGWRLGTSTPAVALLLILRLRTVLLLPMLPVLLLLLLLLPVLLMLLLLLLLIMVMVRVTARWREHRCVGFTPWWPSPSSLSSIKFAWRWLARRWKITATVHRIHCSRPTDRTWTRVCRKRLHIRRRRCRHDGRRWILVLHIRKRRHVRRRNVPFWLRKTRITDHALVRRWRSDRTGTQAFPPLSLLVLLAGALSRALRLFLRTDLLRLVLVHGLELRHLLRLCRHRRRLEVRRSNRVFGRWPLLRVERQEFVD